MSRPGRRWKPAGDALLDGWRKLDQERTERSYDLPSAEELDARPQVECDSYAPHVGVPCLEGPHPVGTWHINGTRRW